MLRSETSGGGLGVNDGRRCGGRSDLTLAFNGGGRRRWRRGRGGRDRLGSRWEEFGRVGDGLFEGFSLAVERHGGWLGVLSGFGIGVAEVEKVLRLLELW
jgi:hypothetical protein